MQLFISGYVMPSIVLHYVYLFLYRSHRGDALLDYVGSGASSGRNQFEGYF